VALKGKSKECFAVSQGNYNFSLSKNPTIKTVVVGEERQPVIIVDNIMEDAQSLVDYAAAEVQFAHDRHTYYPGIRAPLPEQYVKSLRAAMPALTANVFELSSTEPEDVFCQFFSLCTVLPEYLEVPQRFPHADTYEPNQLAILHYLCNPPHGGTSFYRHRETGYESISEDRGNRYLELIRRHIQNNGPPPAEYINGDNDLYEQIESIDAKFDRLIIYRSKVLHSANIDPNISVSADPRAGRLTATAFFCF
jgi:hypothetical protein